MSDPPREDRPTTLLLMKTWSDGEAALVRQLLDSYGIRCQVVSDVTHTVLPICVDGLGEIRILVAHEDLAAAEDILAEHRRQGLELRSGGNRDDPTVSEP